MVRNRKKLLKTIQIKLKINEEFCCSWFLNGSCSKNCFRHFEIAATERANSISLRAQQFPFYHSCFDRCRKILRTHTLHSYSHTPKYRQSYIVAVAGNVVQSFTKRKSTETVLRQSSFSRSIDSPATLSIHSLTESRLKQFSVNQAIFWSHSSIFFAFWKEQCRSNNQVNVLKWKNNVLKRKKDFRVKKLFNCEKNAF